MMITKRERLNEMRVILDDLLWLSRYRPIRHPLRDLRDHVNALLLLLPPLKTGWQDESRTYTPSERSLDNLHDCKPRALVMSLGVGGA